MNIDNLQKKIATPESRLQKNQNLINESYKEVLSGESYEDTVRAVDSIGALQGFRKKLQDIPFSSFHEVVEEMTTINRVQLSEEEKSESIEKLIIAMEERVGRMSPRVADLYMGILSEIKGESYEPTYDTTARKIDELKQKNDLRVLFSPHTSWGMKINRIETRLTDYLLGARALDKRDGKEMGDDIRKWRENELKKSSTKPPERRNESKPGVDPMERLKDGERAPSIWAIHPAYGGYYKEQSFSKWDNIRNVWTEDTYTYSDAETVPFCEEENATSGLVNLTMRAKTVTGKWISLAIPYTHGLHKIEASGKAISVQKDQNDDVLFLIEGNGVGVELNVILAPQPDKKFKSDLKSIRVPEMPAEFSEETNNKIEEIKSGKLGNIKKAQSLAFYTRSHIKYLAPKDRAEGDYYNNFYNTSSKGFAGAVDEIRKADCDVANTYFAALCAKLNIPVRHCIGHSVKGVDEYGASNINSGTGHGWSEVWDEIKKEWTRIDATPPGDSQLEDDEEQSEGGSESVPGDYGNQEAIGPTDEELEKLHEKLAKRREELSYTREERDLSERAGVEFKEARQIVKEINEAENTRLPNGERIVDALSLLFNAIVESRKSIASSYTGPVRKREGGEAIEDIVRHKIGVLSGDTDPLSREKPTDETKEEKIIGGFDVYIIGDKSGSMSNVVEGEELWKMQRRAEYLIFSSIHRFEKNLERAGLQKEDTLSIRTQGISFRGGGKDEIDLDKPLSTEFSVKDKVKMWHSLTDASGGNGDSEALGVIYEQIKDEIAENDRRGSKDSRLRLVVACSDGGYIGDEDLRMQDLAERIGKLSAVVVGIGLTNTAANVKEVMTTKYSHGDIVRDINDLPMLVAKYLIQEAVKLFPEKAKENAEQIIKISLEKFST
ncbi:MAG TPA: hypothetical protein ENI63_00090 [Candidatus Kaiserbacteria bacterium]|nr:hypothetical protein [Candidatus Kaiserbacteria bacterium]